MDLSERLGRVAVFSRRIASIPHLATMINADRIVFWPIGRRVSGLDAVLGWGHKPTARRARRFAARHHLPYLRLEDGFLRSASVGRKGHALSLVVDDEGIYYDANVPSRLESLLNRESEKDPLAEPALLKRAEYCRLRIVEGRLSKYNNATGDVPAWLRNAPRPIVLVVDQTRGDASVVLGKGNHGRFLEMLESAVAEHPTGTVVVKTHPDVRGWGKNGYLTEAGGPRVRLLTERVDPAGLLEVVDQVYTVTSGLGFEALLRGKPVTCFGVPFYSGWGLTEDRAGCSRRKRQRSIDELVAAAMLLYPRYVHPVSRQCCELEDIISHLALQRATYQQNRGKHYCFGFSGWKRRFIRHYLKGPESRVVFVKSAQQAERHGFDDASRILVWGMKRAPGVEELAQRWSKPIYRMEDGFLRSVGLGSDFTAPVSLVIDERGLYYDPSSSSDLETLLQNGSFSASELDEAKLVRERLIRSKLSKYNLGSNEQLTVPKDQRVILVPGQVEDDASVLHGSPTVRTNVALLREVRSRHPDAFIVYKVHPELVSGNRRAGDETGAAELYDLRVESISIDRCLEVADEVHTITSLTGFEGLVRGRAVECYGQPFYAGWGLTRDHHPVERRTRRLTLEQLIAGALIRYPRYYSWRAQAFTSAAQALGELSDQLMAARPRSGSRPGGPRHQLKRALTLAKRVLDAS